ncbi:MAG: leucine-rich repeat domain-containing protein, partial [Gomphosphaeria aponina SAG 52.96 = DSM 107014]|nr:leucine-rich repeat domain-containing protein [Gomphosphaeria aponina SAG 52.96 = DSM 107014]
MSTPEWIQKKIQEVKNNNLTELNLSYNQLSSLPSEITNLTNLTRLDLSDNQLSSLPSEITNLTNLTSLDLRNNQLSSLPSEITNLTNLTRLYLDGNPLENPPLEVCKQGIEAIREYFQKLEEEGYDTIYEAKFIIVGEAESGKTSLMNKLLDPSYKVAQVEESTHGIGIRTLLFTCQEDQEFRVNIWDFGGQEIYHQTHQFFLTKRSLYGLVTDSRKEHCHLDYWLQIVEILSENSPMMIIKNDKSGKVEIGNEGQIRDRFKVMIKDVLDTDLKTNKGLERIDARMKEYIQELPHVGNKLPKAWARVREAIEKDERDYISLDEYLKLCEECNYKSEQKEQEEQKDGRLILSEFLHDLGVILHFQKDKSSLLYDTVILKPEWGTQAVYELLKRENNPVKEKLGKFTFDDLEIIWGDTRYKGKSRELLELMKNFKLCYELKWVEPKTFIAPQLLGEIPPQYQWNPENNLRLIYQYDFMPKGIMSQLIVEMH